VSILYSKLKEVERELNETHNLKRTFPEFPIEVKIPRYRCFRDSLALFYQKGTGFVAWSPNHFTRASLVTSFVPCVLGNTITNGNDPPIRNTSGNATGQFGYWDVKVGQGVGTTAKGDIVLKDASPIAANSGSSARVDAPTSYQRQFSAVFNANVFPTGYTIREVGLFCKAPYDETISGQSFNNGGIYLVSRFSVDDGDFTAFTPNISLPLTVNLIYQWTLA
jgi:hypothetical protein